MTARHEGLITRRSIFIGAAASLLCAPAIVRAARLMPVRRLRVRIAPQYAGFCERLMYQSLDSNLRADEMSTVLNGKIIPEEQRPPDGRVCAGTRMACARGDLVIQFHKGTDIALSCTSARACTALQRRYDPGRIPWIDLLFFRLGTGAGLRLAIGRNGSRRPNCFVLSNNNHAGEWLFDHVDDRVLDRHLYHLSWRFSRCLPCRDLRWPLFLGHGFRGTPDRTPDLGLCLLRRRALCGLLARRLGAGLATFRAFLARRNALLCFGHDCPL
jgi:hypothetical protein